MNDKTTKVVVLNEYEIMEVSYRTTLEDIHMYGSQMVSFMQLVSSYGNK